ncbi:hypothetical protein [Jiulongibacter sp. NS-SX5]|uniref:hypothetical protein n=1 Tax=Jiulongibacter sp. NS-SX5 TaxID=3463854 RepID=UPI0040584B2A
MAQDLPLKTIPEAPAEITEYTLLARMVEGLGFRYYWATEGLRDEDLAYKPSAEARTSMETIEHIYGLVSVIENTVYARPNAGQKNAMSFEDMRAATLHKLKATSDALRNEETVSPEEMKIIFGTTEYPVWNLINGPIEDAVWHVGQVVSFRRASGNPFTKNVSVLTGKVKE